MCANPQSNWLNTTAVRASYILPILKRFPWWKPRKTGGVVYLPPEKNWNRNQFVFLSFGVDSLNWQSFTEIGELACSTTTRCSCGHALKYVKVFYRWSKETSLTRFFFSVNHCWFQEMIATNLVSRGITIHSRGFAFIRSLRLMKKQTNKQTNTKTKLLLPNFFGEPRGSSPTPEPSFQSATYLAE